MRDPPNRGGLDEFWIQEHSVTHKSRAGLNVTREVGGTLPIVRLTDGASRKHGGFTLVTPIVWMRPGILRRCYVQRPATGKLALAAAGCERTQPLGASTSALGPPTKDKAEYDFAEMTDVIVHVGCVVWPDLLGGDRYPLALHVHLNALAPDSTFRRSPSIGWKSLQLQQERPLSRYPFRVELGMVAMAIGCSWPEVANRFDEKADWDCGNEHAKDRDGWSDHR